jgi:hypothetical protein
MAAVEAGQARAIAAAKGKYEGIHAIQKKAATGDRH